MLRTVISINEAACDGCGLCVTGCHEGALAIIDGKARLVREQYCDGLGACIGECPRGAITQERREVAAFSLPAEHPMHGKVRSFEDTPLAERPAIASSDRPSALSERPVEHGPHGHACACPGSQARTIERRPDERTTGRPDEPAPSELAQWPIQLRLVPPQAPWLREADLLVCADCVPFAVADFHQRYLRGHAVVVGCPKLDDKSEMADKLAQIIAYGGVRSLTILRMEVPCCGGIAQAAQLARDAVRPDLPLAIHVVGIGGAIRVQAVG